MDDRRTAVQTRPKAIMDIVGGDRSITPTRSPTTNQCDRVRIADHDHQNVAVYQRYPINVIHRERLGALSTLEFVLCALM